MKRGRMAGVRVLAVACLLAGTVALVLELAGVRDWRAQAGAAVAVAVATVLGNLLQEWITGALNRQAKLDEDRTGRIFMSLARFPWAEVIEREDGFSVSIRDLRFFTADARRRSFVVDVELDKDLHVRSQSFTFSAPEGNDER